MSAQTVEPGYIEVTHPDWCTDTSQQHREDNAGVELVNDLVGVVSIAHTCPGPQFGSLKIEGTRYLPDGSWDFAVEYQRRARGIGGLCVGRGSDADREDSLGELLADLTAASDWIDKAIEVHQ